MKKVKLLVLVAFLLSSCAPAATAVIPTLTQQPTSTSTSTPAPTATQTPSPTTTITPTPTLIGGGSGKFIFEYYKVAYHKEFPDLKGEVNIFTSDLDGNDLTPITNGLNGFNFIESISSDGQMVLISSYAGKQSNSKGDLYLINLNSLDSPPIKLASGLSYESAQAIFLDNTRIIYIGLGSEGYGFYVVNTGGTSPKKIGVPAGKGLRIVSADNARVYWDSIVNKHFKDSSGFQYAYGDFDSLWWMNIDGSGQGKLESSGQQVIGSHYAFSPDGNSLAWIPAQEEPECSDQGLWAPWIRDGTYNKYGDRGIVDQAYVNTLVSKCLIMHVASLSKMDRPIGIALLPPFNPTTDNFMYHREYQLAWFPDSSRILAYDDGHASWMANLKATDNYPIAFYEIALKDANPKLTLLKILSNKLSDRFSLPIFSPDGKQLLVANWAGGPFIRILDLNTLIYNDLFGNKLAPDSDVSRIGSIYWLP